MIHLRFMRYFAKCRLDTVLEGYVLPGNRLGNCRLCYQIRKLHCTTTCREIVKKINSIHHGPGLKDFIVGSSMQNVEIKAKDVPYLTDSTSQLGKGRSVFFDVYGCQMNVNDTEVVWSILKNAGYHRTLVLEDADVVLVMTCAIREGAETKVWNKLDYLKGLKNLRSKKKSLPSMKIGILGCMAERLKLRLLEREGAVDVVAGPDAYRDLPRLLSLSSATGQAAANVLLSFDETYADVTPLRLDPHSVTAYVTIMRGCDNMCTFCIVPFTRGRERSRPISSILDEVKYLSDEGIKEVTLLGQNVNSYRDVSEEEYYGGLQSTKETKMSKGFKTVYKLKRGGLRFIDLLDKVSLVNPEMRIRFTSPHPKDFPDEVLQLIRERPNICNNLHLPAQSGNDIILERMRRGHTRQSYLELVHRVKEILPTVTLSSDFICGFCGETEEQFEDTLSLMSYVRYHMAFMFAYSLREKTVAHRKMQDDVPSDVKLRRLESLSKLFRKIALELNEELIGCENLVLVQGVSKRSNAFLAGRNDGNTKVIIPAGSIPENFHSCSMRPIKPGDYVVTKITEANSQVLKGLPLFHSTLSKFHQSWVEGHQGISL